MYKEISTAFLREKLRLNSYDIAELLKQKENIQFELDNKYEIGDRLRDAIEEREPELVQAINIE
jgi:hypothetical protein